MQHAHEHGIIHRDIKPHNILLGRDGRAKVTDFGIAVGMSDVTMTYNSTSRIMGSVHYISPEQVQGLGVTEKSDIYSCGVVFYEMLTGRVPFVGETPIAIAMQHVQGELLLPHQINPEIPMGISYVVMRAMRKNPDTRYANSLEMTEAIRAAYQGMNDVEPQQMDTDALGGLIVKTKKTVQTPAEDVNSIKESRRKPNSSRLILFGIAIVLLVAIIIIGKQLLGYISMENNKVEVPNVVGYTQQQAESMLAELELVPVIVSKGSSEFEAGIVMEQSILEGQEVSRGRSITLTVSEGTATVEVPDLKDYTQRIAELTLANMGLSSIVSTEYNDEVPKGPVILHSPDQGTRVGPGSTVELLVSLGAEPVKFVMENLVGKTMAEIQEYITENQLTIISTTQAESFEYESGKIIQQSLAAGSTVQTADQLELVISSGPGPNVKTFVVNYVVPQDYKHGQPVEVYHTVVISVDDAQGYREVFNESLAGESTVNYTVEYNNIATISLTVDGELVESWSLQ